MNVSFSKCRDILATLPIGYYLGYKVPVELSEESPATYVEITTHKIKISFPMIRDALKNCKTSADPETTIRSLLYHEVSHCICTPRDLNQIHKYIPSKQAHRSLKLFCANHFNAINIVEDERIETLLRTYYMRTNFRKTVAEMNAPRTGEEMAASKNPLDRFYAAVRFRIGPAWALNCIERILAVYTDIICSDGTCRSSIAVNYVKDIKELYEMFTQSGAENAQDNSANADAGAQNNQGNDSKNSGENAANDDGSGNGQSDRQSMQPKQKQKGPIENRGEPDSPEKEAEKFIQTIARIHGQAWGGAGAALTQMIREWCENRFGNPEAKRIKAAVEKIVASAMNRRRNESNAANGYAGRIDPRSCTNKDYRWFITPRNGSTANRFTKVQLNLFVDDSGSFYGSRDLVNGLLEALEKVEKQYPAFSFDVIRVGSTQTLQPKDQRFVICGGGSWLRNNLIDIYKRVQNPQAMTVNLGVFDGHFHLESDHIWGVFNHPNCYLISDTTNRSCIDEDCPSAVKKFIEDDYAEHFTEEVLTALSRLLN